MATNALNVWSLLKRASLSVACLAFSMGAMAKESEPATVDGLKYVITGEKSVSVVGYDAQKMAEKYELDSVEIQGSFYRVTSVGDGAFKDCGKLSVIKCPYVTSIGKSAFRNCSNLYSALFGVVTNISDYALAECGKLRSFVMLQTDPKAINLDHMETIFSGSNPDFSFAVPLSGTLLYEDLFADLGINLTVDMMDLGDIFDSKLYIIDEICERADLYHYYDLPIYLEPQGDYYMEVGGVIRYNDGKFTMGNQPVQSDSTKRFWFSFGSMSFLYYPEYEANVSISGEGDIIMTPQRCAVDDTMTITASKGTYIEEISVIFGCYSSGDNAAFDFSQCFPLGEYFSFQQILEMGADFALNYKTKGYYPHIYLVDGGEDVLSIVPGAIIGSVEDCAGKHWCPVRMRDDDFTFVCADVPVTTVREGKEYSFVMPSPITYVKVKLTSQKFNSTATYVVVTDKEGKQHTFETSSDVKVEWKSGSVLNE